MMTSFLKCRGLGRSPKKLLIKKIKKEKESSRMLQRYNLPVHVGMAPWRSFIMRKTMRKSDLISLLRQAKNFPFEITVFYNPRALEGKQSNKNS